MNSTSISEQEVARYRQDTPGTQTRIHFNNAGSALPPEAVVQAVTNYLQEEARIGGYEAEAKYKDDLEQTYTLIARLINAGADEIALVENASMAWGMAFNGIDFKPGDVILTSEMEYVANLIGFLHVQQTRGVQLQVIPNDEQGCFSVEALEAAITPQTKLIAITHIPSASGAMLPVEAIGRVARRHGVLYLVDACQTVGQAPIDVEAIGCDFLSVTGRKYLRAPRGTGFLYVRKAVQSQLNVLFMDAHTAVLSSEHSYELRPDGRRFELYEKSRALTLGLARAVDYALSIGVDRIWQRVQHLAALLRRQLSQLPGLTLHDRGAPLCGIVTFSISGVDSLTVKTRLSEKHINVSVGSAQSTLIYMNRNQLTSVVRASVHYYNTEEEVARFCEAVREIAEGESSTVLTPATG